MIDDQVRHQFEISGYILDFPPPPDGRIHLQVVDYGKAVVRAKREKGKNMHC